VLAQEQVPDSILKESWQLRAEALYLAGDCRGVKDLAGRLPDLGEVTRRQVGGWVARCDFEQRVFQSALVPPGPFR